MPLVIRTARPADVAVLETLELETLKRLPERTAWLNTFRALVVRALADEPSGFLVADYDGRAIGSVIARTGATHPLTGQKVGHLEHLNIAPTWRAHGVGEQLVLPALAYLKEQGCEVALTTLHADVANDGDALKQAGFKVAAWELERSL